MFPTNLLSLTLFSFCILLVCETKADESLQKALFKKLVQQENIHLIIEVMDNISGVIDKLILSDNLEEEDYIEAFPLGWKECFNEKEYHFKGQYCLYEKNKAFLEEILESKYKDTCTTLMNEFPYSSLLEIDILTQRYLEDCIEQRLKVFSFGRRNNFTIPIDFTTNRFRRWKILAEISKEMKSILGF